MQFLMPQLIGYNQRGSAVFNGTVNWLHIREEVQFLMAQLFGYTSERQCSF